MKKSTQKVAGRIQRLTWKRCLLLVALFVLLLTGCAQKSPSAVNVEPELTASPTPAVDQTQDGFTEVLPTPTLSPPPTPTPSPTPVPVQDVKRQKGYISKDGVNLREGPSTDTEVLDTLKRATVLTITGEAQDWYRVEIGEIEGFVSQEFVGKGDVPLVLTVTKLKRQNGVVIASKVNMREGPSTKENSIKKLELFTHFTITGETEKWYEIEYQGETGYVTKEYAEFSQGYYEKEDLYLVAQLVHQEAKGTSQEGQTAVANVVYNRVRSRRYPNTIETVVFQDGQFSPADNEDKLRSVRPGRRAIEAVLQIFVRGETILPRDVLYFRAARLGTTWSSARRYYDTYGGNCFFK